MAWYGWAGLTLIALAKAVRWAGLHYGILPALHRWVATWFTPIVWWGYILFLDAWLARRTRRSFLQNYPGEFIFMLIASNVCWLIFEDYNLLLRNWVYQNLPESLVEEWIGSFFAYATIFPGIFGTASVLAQLLGLPLQTTARPLSVRARWLSMAVGLAMLLGPLVAPARYRPYLFAPVWLGFIFLLDPVNERLGGVSLLAQAKARNFQWIGTLLAAGYVCGFLWEYWNSWAETRWVYRIPFPTVFRIFEMPLLGFLGFGPFALECFCMYETCRRVWRRTFRRPRMAEAFLMGALGHSGLAQGPSGDRG
jgi:hypothetical protein